MAKKDSFSSIQNPTDGRKVPLKVKVIKKTDRSNNETAPVQKPCSTLFDKATKMPAMVIDE
jgi:hypothetical protein